jgi:hypothetical protein
MSVLGFGEDTPQQKQDKLRRYKNDINDDSGAINSINSEVDALRDDVYRFSSTLGSKMWDLSSKLYESYSDPNLSSATSCVQQEINALANETTCQ